MLDIWTSDESNQRTMLDARSIVKDSCLDLDVFQRFAQKHHNVTGDVPTRMNEWVVASLRHENKIIS